jgi:hypothetical protein
MLAIGFDENVSRKVQKDRGGENGNSPREATKGMQDDEIGKLVCAVDRVAYLTSITVLGVTQDP